MTLAPDTQDKFAEYAHPERLVSTETRLTAEDGQLTVPDRPGLGIEWDERAVEEFYGQFQTAEGGTLRINEDEAEAMDASERGQERVQVKKKA